MLAGDLALARVESAGRRGGLDLVVLFEVLQSLPEAYPSAEQDWDHHDVHVVDEPRSKEVADHGGPRPGVLPIRRPVTR
jgi:hypothetical protein